MFIGDLRRDQSRHGVWPTEGATKSDYVRNVGGLRSD
jgi:hypothetical protein